jgi:uncharacterized phage protein gp47/JayE
MAITTTGYSLKRYEDIIAEVRQAIITASGNPNIDLSDDSLLGTLNNVWATKYAELYELAQAHWSAMDPDTATGQALDKLVRRARITRLQAVKAFGELHFSGNIGTIVNSGTQVKDLAGNVVATQTQLTLNLNDINTVQFNTPVNNSTVYSLSLTDSNGTATASYTTDSTATLAEIVAGFTNILSSLPQYVVSSVGGRLQINSVNKFTVSGTQTITPVQVTKAVLSQALVASTEDFEQGALNSLVTPQGTLTVTNRDKWTTGRLEETDNELRNRFYASRGGAGNATVEAIYAKLNAITNVQSAFIEENYSNVTNVNGLPSKSFEATVKGGSDLDVATAIWQAKPAGIQAFGNTSYEIRDSENDPQIIFFSRPIDAYIHVRVLYQIYSEEIFPSNGEQMIARAVKAYGDALQLNEDVNPQRIMSAVYQSVQGINNLQITIGKTASPLDTPTYTSSVIPVARKEEAVFDLARILVSPQ